MHTYMHAYIHSYVRTYIPTHVKAYDERAYPRILVSGKTGLRELQVLEISGFEVQGLGGARETTKTREN